MNLFFSSLLTQPFNRKASIQIVASLALTLASITANAQEAPVIVNQETGAQVDLIRPYWNANVDIANRRVQCDHFLFDQESAVYEKREVGGDPRFSAWRSHGEFFHHPLLEGLGSSAVDHAFLAEYRTGNTWVVRDGMYGGLAPLGGFIELVTYNTASNVTENNAVRVWRAPQDTDPYYFVCYDLDGTPLVPTGSAELGNTGLLPEQNFTFQLPLSGTPITETPEIVRRDTGELVEFVRAEFDFNSDLKGKSMNCGPFGWAEETGSYVGFWRGSGAGTDHTFSYAYTGGDRVSFEFGYDDGGLLPSEGSIDNFMPYQDASFIEVVDFGYNVWINADNLHGCRLHSRGVEGLEPFAPNRILLTVQGSCDYSAADEYDGWGWNAATQQGCPPEDNLDNEMNGESTNEQLTDGGMSSVESNDVDNNTSGDNEENGIVEQSNNGNSDEVEADIPETVSDITGNDSTNTDNTEDQSNVVDNTPVQTSGSGAADKFLLLLLICFIARRPTGLENRTK